jgi:glucose/arabinose dehydrogenase
MIPPVLRRRAAVLMMGVMLIACGSSPPSVSPTLQASVTATASHEATPTPTPAPSPTPRTFDPLEVVSLASIPAAEKGLPSLQAHTVARGNYPAGLSVAPDGRIFFSELYGGHINTIDAQGRTTMWYDVNAHFHIHWTQYYHGGLTAVTVDPDFTRNHYVFAVSQVPSPSTNLPVTSMILRFTERNGRGTAPTVLLTTRADKFDNIYSLVFAPDETIFIPSGHGARVGVGDVPKDQVGEILHITRDGAPVPDNPLGSKAPDTWAYGIRNAFDIAFDPESGYLVAGENGSVGHDEIDLVAPGRYYGWRKYEGIASAPGMTQPLLDFGPETHWAPVGMLRYVGAKYPKLRGMYLMCFNHQPGVYAMRIDTDSPARLRSFTKIAPLCSIDIAAATDGTLYIADPRGIYRLS